MQIIRALSEILFCWQERLNNHVWNNKNCISYNYKRSLNKKKKIPKYNHGAIMQNVPPPKLVNICIYVIIVIYLNFNGKFFWKSNGGVRFCRNVLFLVIIITFKFLWFLQIVPFTNMVNVSRTNCLQITSMCTIPLNTKRQTII